ncbi:sensor histidine kinase [Sphaerisporangium fuscum]|uniref:sensor histidine kinase n=1 Tax=Sphaerisporangium fuscum TaxID=2835868 RepID=UPI001BDCC64D|nr:sensor histidine kinase [Sphaerisporangium fuscum]
MARRTAPAWCPPAPARYGPAVLLTLVALAESFAHARGVPSAAFGESVTAPGMMPPPGGVVGYADMAPRAGGPGSALRYTVTGLIALATTLPVAPLWAQPAAAALIVSTTVTLSLAAFHTLTVAGAVAQLVTGYRLGRTGSQPLALLLAAPFPVLALTGTPGGETGTLTLLLACLAPAAALTGVARRARGEALAGTAARQVIADTLLEHTARGERARIARELHDVVAHHISMVAVQAETARLAVPGMPAAGAERLSAIGDTARSALTEMRRLLGVLREDAETDAPARRPQPGLSLAELNELLDESRDASRTGTRLILRGPPVPLDPGVELAAYRIVQEALTNARRHAPGAAVDVELHYTGGTLRLSVRDNGPGPHATEDGPGGRTTGSGGPAPRGTRRDGPGPVTAGGHGLAGMRERAAAVGGELRTGPGPGGGFLVEALLPGKEATAA